MFVILPVFALWARRPPGLDASRWSGMALGAYGLTQALLQMPFGWLSDRCGRKPVIYVGPRDLRRRQLRLRALAESPGR